MWAVKGRQPNSLYGLFNSKWKAESALEHLWNLRLYFIERVFVEQNSRKYFTIYKHEYKKAS